jgi:hypothetical protein
MKNKPSSWWQIVPGSLLLLGGEPGWKKYFAVANFTQTSI